jgi:hypothetical protein
MIYVDHQDKQHFILDTHEDAVVSNPVSPEAALTAERFAHQPRVLGMEPIRIGSDAAANGFVEPACLLALGVKRIR